MGGGDLNMKKSWHPERRDNLEKVWLREKKAAEEQRKLEQLMKERKEEREREELMQLQNATGRNKKSLSRLEWMYAAGPGQNQQEIDEDKEAFLLGKKKVDKLVEQGKSVEEMSSGVVFSKRLDTIYGMTANSSRDMAAKIREDPLLMIKKQEQSSLKAVLSNPLKLKQLEQLKKAEKKHKKEKKKDRKKKKSKRSEDASESSGSDIEKGRSDKKDHIHQNDSISKRRRSPSPESPIRGRNGAYINDKRNLGSSYDSKSPTRRRRRSRSVERSPHRYRRRDESYERNYRDGYRKRSISPRPSSRRDRDRSFDRNRRHDLSPSHARSRRISHSRSRSRSIERRDRRWNDSSRVKRRRSPSLSPSLRLRRSPSLSPSPRRNSQYEHTSNNLKTTSYSSNSEKKVVEIPSSENNDEEEKKRLKLEAMMANAQKWEKEREDRVQQGREQEKKEIEAEEEARKKRSQGPQETGDSDEEDDALEGAGDSFLKDLQRQTYLQSDISASELIQRRKAYNQKL